jgi:transmembrane 9 superfamily protein 2/4
MMRINYKMISIICVLLLGIFPMLYTQRERGESGIDVATEEKAEHLEKGHKIPMDIYVGSLNSEESHLPFDFHYLKLCGIREAPEKKEDVIGEILRLESVYTTRYTFNFDDGKNTSILTMCEPSKDKERLTDSEALKLQWFIQRKYDYRFYLDDLPSALKKTNGKSDYRDGVPLGFTIQDESEKKYFIYNHLVFHVKYKPKLEEKPAIEGFSVEPFSISGDGSFTNPLAYDETVKRYSDVQLASFQQVYEGAIIKHTYEVKFTQVNQALSKSDHKTRWDHYMEGEDQIYWFSLLNSSIIILIVSVLVLYIFTRVLKKEIEVYNINVTADDIIDDQGWKMVSNDVFRRPKNSMIFSALVGTGVQVTNL